MQSYSIYYWHNCLTSFTYYSETDGFECMYMLWFILLTIEQQNTKYEYINNVHALIKLIFGTGEKF
jgi:hypothetical protein